LILCSFVFLLLVLGRMPKFYYVDILPFNFKNSVVWKLVGRTLCVNVRHNSLWVSLDFEWIWTFLLWWNWSTP
jgi:hypothetical protein